MVALSAVISTCAARQSPIQNPPGSEAAVNAFHKALPGATLKGVEAPKNFGAEAADGSPLFWTIRYELGGVAGEVPITPDGLIMKLKQRISAGDLPAAVAKGISKEANGSKVTTYERQETRATLKYVSLQSPTKYYMIQATQSGKSYLIVARPDGTISSQQQLGAENEGGEKAEEAAEKSSASTPKEIQVPKEQRKAVDCVKAAYPGALVQAVESVGYDDGTGEMSVLSYEVEFPWHGSVKEAHATPDGDILDYDRKISEAELPKAVRDAIGAKLPNSTIKSAKQMEDHAELKFVALTNPKTTYIIGLTANGKSRQISFTSEGKKITPFSFSQGK